VARRNPLPRYDPRALCLTAPYYLVRREDSATSTHPHTAPRPLPMGFRLPFFLGQIVITMPQHLLNTGSNGKKLPGAPRLRLGCGLIAHAGSYTGRKLRELQRGQHLGIPMENCLDELIRVLYHILHLTRFQRRRCCEFVDVLVYVLPPP